MKIISIIVCLAFAQISLAQSGNILGSVTTNDGKPVGDVTLSLKPVKRTVISDIEGRFNIKADTGAYTLVISFVGMKTEERKLVVRENETTLVKIVLWENTTELKEVIINSYRNLNERTLSSVKSRITNMDLPQMVGTVSNTVINDQQATRVGEIVRNVSGVSLSQTRLGVNETYTARGYSIGVNGVTGSVLKNGMITNTAGMPEAATLESVEVMKGSSALLYGNVSGGLIVNMITKKPKFERGGEVKMQVGSFNQYKPILDLYGPVVKNLAFRIVGTYENDRSFRDVVKTRRIYFNPSFIYKLGKNTSILFQGDHLDAKLTPDFGIGMLDSGRVLPSTIPVSRFLNVAWAYNNVKQSSASLNLDHKLNEKWNLNFAVSAQRTDVDSYGASMPNVVNKNGDWNRSLARAHGIEKNYGSQVNLNGKFSTGKISHQFLIGTDFTRIVIMTDAFKVVSYDKINILDPLKFNARTDIPAETLNTSTTAPGNRFGIYTQDLISLFPKIKLLAGLRWSYQENFRTRVYTAATQAITAGTAATAINKAFSPKLAIIYQPAKTTSVFASYANNFTVNSGTDIYGQMLKPSIINQYELGIKNSFFKTKLSANFSIYRILNSNLAQQAEFRADGTLNPDATVKELRGQTTSDGLEIDLNGILTKNFYFIAGYGYNNMRFTKTSGSKGSNIEGEKLVNNPAHTGNMTIFYTFRKSSLRGLKIGASGFYTGKRLGGYNNTIGQTQVGSRLIPLSGFTVFDLSAGYGFRKITLLVKLSNVFNEVNYLVHDNYSIAPVTPRQLTGTISYRF